MRSRRVLHAVDSHTEGMPTRVITGGMPVLPGATMLDRKLWFEANCDDVRLLLMREPRGHAAMSGAILQPPTREVAVYGVLFIEVSGCLPMCGHGTIGVATVLVETGMVPVVEPITTVRLDTPAGVVVVRVAVSGGRAVAVTLRNVPAYVEGLDRAIEVPGLGMVTYDLAFGGNFYAFVPAAAVGLAPTPEHADGLIRVGGLIMDAINAAGEPVHLEDERIHGVHHVVLYEGARAATSIHPGWLDRSPCGTGTSARLAVKHARGELRLGEEFEHRSVLDTAFVGRLVEETTVGGRPAAIPEITGRAWITGMGQYLLDPSDPFPAGFSL